MRVREKQSTFYVIFIFRKHLCFTKAIVLLYFFFFFSIDMHFIQIIENLRDSVL